MFHDLINLSDVATGRGGVDGICPQVFAELAELLDQLDGKSVTEGAVVVAEEREFSAPFVSVDP
ncbi:MAG TPA: hypothetical protein VIK61_08775 [Acidimicrobiia bacterium]